MKNILQVKKTVRFESDIKIATFRKIKAIIKVTRLLYRISEKDKNHSKDQSKSTPISMLKSPEKTRQLPSWMSNVNIPENKGSDVQPAPSTKGTIKQITTKLQPNVMPLKLDCTHTDIKANGNESKSNNRAKATFLKKWGWAIGNIDDFGDEANVIIDTTSDNKSSSNLNNDKGEISIFRNLINRTRFGP